MHTTFKRRKILPETSFFYLHLRAFRTNLSKQKKAIFDHISVNDPLKKAKKVPDTIFVCYRFFIYGTTKDFF